METYTLYDRTMPDEEYDKLAVDGKFIKKGGARTVFEIANDPSAVLKKVHQCPTGPNWVEWIVWNSVKKNNFGGVFGECYSISHTGRFLIMEKLVDIPTTETAGIKIPVWMRDVWPNSFGKNSNGNIKLRDYGLVDLSEALDDDDFILTSW